MRASVAKLSTALIGPIELSNTGKATANEILANSSSTISASRLPSPSPPWSSSRLTPRKPSPA